MILCLGTTPAAQRVMMFERLQVDRVNRAVRILDGAAGKSINVAKVLRVLGARSVALGFLGGDRGQEMLRLLQDRGVECEFVTVTARTRECVTVIDESAGTVTELVEESAPVDPADYDTLLRFLEKRMLQCRGLVLSGTIASGGPVDLYARCTRMAHEAGALSVVDASGQPLLAVLEANPGLVKPNRAELEATLGSTLADENAVRMAMSGLHARGAQRVVVTAGADPTLAFDGEHFWRVTSPQVPVLNPIGSGDAFTAGLTWKLVQGAGLEEACRWAAAAGAANALTPMAGEVNQDDVKRLVTAVKVERF